MYRNSYHICPLTSLASGKETMPPLSFEAPINFVRAIPIKSETTKASQNASKPTAFIVSGALPALTINIHERSHVVISQAR